MFYLIVSFAILAYRVYKAAQTDFTFGPEHRFRKENEINADKVVMYAVTTVIISVFWIFVLPCYGFWLLGKRFKKEAK